MKINERKELLEKKRILTERFEGIRSQMKLLTKEPYGKKVHLVHLFENVREEMIVINKRLKGK